MCLAKRARPTPIFARTVTATVTKVFSPARRELPALRSVCALLESKPQYEFLKKVSELMEYHKADSVCVVTSWLTGGKQSSGGQEKVIERMWQWFRDADLEIRSRWMALYKSHSLLALNRPYSHSFRL